MYSNRKFNIFVFTLLGFSVLLLLIREFSFVHEDAWLTHRFTRNLVEGNGLVSQLGLKHDEGFSSLGWVLGVAGISKLLHLDVILSGKILAYFSFLGILLISSLIFNLIYSQFNIHFCSTEKGEIKNYNFLLGSFLLLIGIGWSESYLHWVNGLLETAWYSFLNALILYLILKIILSSKDFLYPMLGLLLTVSWASRPEGILNSIICITSLIIYFYFDGLIRIRKYQLIKTIICFLLTAALLVAWRISYYNDLLSSAAYVKLGLRIWTWNPFNYLLDIAKSKGTLFTLLVIGSLLFSIYILIDLFVKRKKLNTVNLFKQASILLILILNILSQFFVVFYTGGEGLGLGRFLIPQFHSLIILYAFCVCYIEKYINSLLIKLIYWVCIFAITVTASLGDMHQVGVSLTDAVLNSLNLIKNIESPYEQIKKTINYKEAHKIILHLSKSKNKVFAHSEFGIIPWIVTENSNYIGLDILGLNTRQVARNFKYFPFEEVFYASRDFILFNRPSIIGCHSIYKAHSGSQKESWSYFDLSQGKIEVGPAIAWAMNPYMESNFFVSFYRFDLVSETQGTWPSFYYDEKFTASSKIDLTKFEDFKNQLMHGFFLNKENQTVASQYSRFIIGISNKSKKLCISGTSLEHYENDNLKVELRINDEAVGDKILGVINLKPLESFRRCIQISHSINFNDKDVLFSIKGSVAIKSSEVHHERKLGKDLGSFIIETIETQE